MLDCPQIYWEARADASIWFRFAEFEAMNLGPIPPVPANLLARGIPEPAVAVTAAVMLLALGGRRA
jgi:hypothetical protein